MTVMGVWLGGTCMLVFCSHSPSKREHFWLSSFVVRCSVADWRFVSVWCRWLAAACSPRMVLHGAKLLQENHLHSQFWGFILFLCPCCLLNVWKPLSFLPSSQCCLCSVILTGAVVTITGSVFSAGCQSLLDHQIANDTWLFSSRIVICIPKCTT